MPMCFDTHDDWMKWYNLARRGVQRTTNPCDDCTRAYREEMTAVGRCELALAAAAVVPGQRKKVV
jgi:hypothetical protein